MKHNTQNERTWVVNDSTENGTMKDKEHNEKI